MILQVLRDKVFDERMRDYLNHGGPALSAARRANEIIGKIVRGGRTGGVKFGRRTRNGEMRIRNCIKYDLGNGYRMVCLRRDTRFVALFIGTHDECSRWLERNRDLAYEWSTAPHECRETAQAPVRPLRKERDPAEIYEEDLLRSLDDTTLRKIFCGICGRAKRRPGSGAI